MSEIIYGLCALTSLLCAYLLLQSYRRRRIALLFWSGLFFGIQTFNNSLLVVDKLVLPDTDLSLFRYVIAFCANAALLYGFIMRVEVD